MKDYFQSPVNNSWVNFAGHPHGDAMDLGWRTPLSNYNQDVFAMADGKVVYTGYLSDGGNTVVISHSYSATQDAWVGLMHFVRPAVVKVGENVKRGQKVGNMGNTGVSGGEHVHVRMSLVPKGSAFNWDLFNRTRVNPFNYVYEFSHQDVLDMKKKPSKPFIEPAGNEKAESGEITVTAKEGLRVRKSPSLKAEQTGLLAHGAKREYTHYVDAEGIRWVKLKEGGYAARRQLDNSRIYADARFLNQAPAKPKPKPTDVGKYANMSGLTRLFKVSRNDGTYPDGTINRHTDLRARSAKILAEDNGRFKVNVPSFNPSTVWVAKSEVTVSNSPKYPVN